MYLLSDLETSYISLSKSIALVRKEELHFLILTQKFRNFQSFLNFQLQELAAPLRCFLESNLPSKWFWVFCIRFVLKYRSCKKARAPFFGSKPQKFGNFQSFLNFQIQELAADLWCSLGSNLPSKWFWVFSIRFVVS